MRTWKSVSAGGARVLLEVAAASRLLGRAGHGRVGRADLGSGSNQECEDWIKSSALGVKDEMDSD